MGGVVCLFILFERVSCIAKEDEMQRKRQRRIQSIASIVLAGVAVAIVLVSLGADLIEGRPGIVMWCVENEKRQTPTIRFPASLNQNCPIRLFEITGRD